MIVHAVLLKLRPTTSDDQIRSFARLLSDACTTIESVRRATVTRDLAIDAGYRRSMGDSTYNFMAVLEFDDVAGLQEYLAHPLHAEVGRRFWEICESTVIFEGTGSDITGKQADDWVSDLTQQ